MMTPREPSPDIGVFVISVAAQLTGLHPQTLRTYERMGLITPDRTVGGGRRYSPRDIDLLRTIAELTSAGIGIEGVRRILDLEQRLARMTARHDEALAELQATREMLRQALAARRTDPAAARTPPPGGNLPMLRAPEPGQSVVVWRRGR